MRIDLLTEMKIEDGQLPAHAHPGGYPLYYVTKDGGNLCPPCANGENGSEAANPECQDDPQWELVAVQQHLEGGPVTCDHCYAEIESAYGDPAAEKQGCPDCEATKDSLHTEGCDQEQCPFCGLQLIGCEHAGEDIPDEQRIPWDGTYRGEADARRLGLFARRVSGFKGYIPCGEHDEGAVPDFNRLMAFCVWNPLARRFEAPEGGVPTFDPQPE